MKPAEDALVLTLLPHGEQGAVVRFLCARSGLVAAFVPGARSRRRRADLSPGNRVRLWLKDRASGGLATASLEPLASRALLAFAPDTAAALAYLTHLPAVVLAEGDAEPALYAALDTLLSDLQGPGWPSELARFELLLLGLLGFGLDLGACALTGATSDLLGVSPRSGRAVSSAAAAGKPWAKSLLPLPSFLTDPGIAPDAAELAAAFHLTGHFLARTVFPEAPRLGPLRARCLELALAPAPALSPAR